MNPVRILGKIAVRVISQNRGQALKVKNKKKRKRSQNREVMKKIWSCLKTSYNAFYFVIKKETM